MADDGMTIGELFDGTAWKKFKQIKLTTHVFAGAAGFLGIMWAADPAFRGQVEEIVKAMPHWMQGVITMGSMMAAFYKTTHNPTTRTVVVPQTGSPITVNGQTFDVSTGIKETP